jgi:hypothetical protein
MLIEHGHLPSAGDATALLLTFSLMINDKENDDGCFVAHDPAGPD